MAKKAHRYWVYIMGDFSGRYLYTGVTSALDLRSVQHASGLGGGYTAKHEVCHLLYYEEHRYVLNAIKREKQIKAGSRADKVSLIVGMNPEWKDLFGLLKAMI